MRQALIILAVATLSASEPIELRAQTSDDSAAVARALAQQLAQDERVRRYEVRSESTLFRDVLVEELGGRAILALDGRPPRCAWGWAEREERPFGYLVSTISAAMSPGTAVVVVHFSCDNPPGYTHDRFGKRMEFQFARGSQGWQFVRSQLLWIT